jgi:hypothetical protein
MEAQEGYLTQLIREKRRFEWEALATFAELEQAASFSGEGLIALARDEENESLKSRFHKDG